jgi:hypothetical protein
MTAQARPATASSFAASKPPPQPQLASSQWQSSLPARPATAGVRRANQGGSSASGAPFSDVQFMTATGRSGGGSGSTQQMHAAANDAEDLGETIDMNDEQPPETTATPSTKLVGRRRFHLMCPLFLVCLLKSFCVVRLLYFVVDPSSRRKLSKSGRNCDRISTSRRPKSSSNSSNSNNNLPHLPPLPPNMHRPRALRPRPTASQARCSNEAIIATNNSGETHCFQPTRIFV